MNDRWFATSVAGGGLLAGLLLWLLSFAISHAHISGNGWSLTGNGILIIPFGLGPAIGAGVWAAIILRMRGHARWLELGLASALIGLVLLAGSFLSLVLFGAANRDAGATASLFFGFLLYGWILGSAVTAGSVPAPDPHRAGPPWWSIAALLLMPVTLIAGCQAGSALVST